MGNRTQNIEKIVFVFTVRMYYESIKNCEPVEPNRNKIHKNMFIELESAKNN